MVAIAGATASSGLTLPLVLGPSAVERLARWMLVAVGLDLLLTRFLVRMAIFVPKGEPWSALAAVLGRVGAAADAIVPVVGLLLLIALLARAGRSGGRLERALPVGLAMVAAGGIALLAFPTTPLVVVVLEGLVVAVAGGSAWLAADRRDVPVLARAGFVSLAVSVALAGLARGVTAAAQMGVSDSVLPDGLPSLVGAGGEVAFVAGAALLGLAGLRVIRSGLGRAPVDRAPLIAGALVGLGILLAAARSPEMFGALAIWSIGVTGVVPPIALAAAAGLATAGLPILVRRTPEPAVGGAIVLLAGFGLAASGLVLASLAGLVVGATGPRPGRGTGDAETPSPGSAPRRG